MKTHELDFPMNVPVKSPARIYRSSVRRMLAGLAVASGLTAASWALGVAPVTWISKSVSAGTKPKATAASQVPKDAEPEFVETTIKLNYFSASWARVLQDLAATGDMEVVADKLPTGRFSRMDRAEYSRKEAIRIVNKDLQDRGFKLIEKGRFLVLLQLTNDHKNYAPAVLPQRAQPKPNEEDQDETVRSEGFRSDSITNPRERNVNRAVYTEDVADKSLRNNSNKKRPQSSDNEPDRDRTTAARKSTGSRSVRQTSLEEMNDGSAAAAPRKPHPIDSSVPAMLDDVGDPAPSVTYRARQLTALELSKRVYRAMKSSAEKVDSGRNGLPAFSIVSPQFKSADPKKPNAAPQNVEFMVSIDESRNELLIDGSEKDTSAVLKLFANYRQIRRGSGSQTDQADDKIRLSNRRTTSCGNRTNPSGTWFQSHCTASRRWETAIHCRPKTTA